MTDAPPPAPPAPPAHLHGPLARGIVAALVAVLIAAAVYGLFFTTHGARLRADPHQAGQDFHAWVDGHGVVAPLVFVALFVAVSLTLVPVWWLQILAGYGFGLWFGILYTLVGAALGAAAGFLVSRTLIADWVQLKFEARHAKLRELDEKMGHNGLLVVMAVRLTHLVPFGASNYAFGVTRINLVELVVGTLLGNLPVVAFYVAAGAQLHPWKNWRFILAIAAVNLLLLVPVVLRYARPQWFKRIGLE
jgi:uncharacterized membrane protein YdjX (TVP38/TMEM64 family)